MGPRTSSSRWTSSRGGVGSRCCGQAWIALAACVGALGCGGSPSDDCVDPTPRNTVVVAADEWVCEPLADLTPVATAFETSDLRTTVEGIAQRRYPTALEVLPEISDASLRAYFTDPTSFAAVAGGFDIPAHEGTHLWDGAHSSGGCWSYRVRDGVVINTRRVFGFPRGEVLEFHANPGADPFAHPYLVVLGYLGLDSLLEEYNAFAHTLAARYCTREFPQTAATTGRSAMLVFMYYVELYLEVARTRHQAVYSEIASDSGLVPVILNVWDRAEYWLALWAKASDLDATEREIAAWTYGDDSRAEIVRLRRVQAAP